MSVYNKERIKELFEEQLKKDLTEEGRGEPINVSFTLSKDEFIRLWYVFQISEYPNTSDFFNHWKFYLSDDISEEIILEDNELKQMYSDPYDFTIDECLEEAKEIKLIKGFFELGNDLWIINNRGE